MSFSIYSQTMWARVCLACPQNGGKRRWSDGGRVKGSHGTTTEQAGMVAYTNNNINIMPWRWLQLKWLRWESKSSRRANNQYTIEPSFALVRQPELFAAVRWIVWDQRGKLWVPSGDGKWRAKVSETRVSIQNQAPIFSSTAIRLRECLSSARVCVC